MADTKHLPPLDALRALVTQWRLFDPHAPERSYGAQDCADDLETLLGTFEDFEFRVLRTEPGDVVVFTTPLSVAQDTAERIKAYAESSLLPGVKVFVFGDGLTVDGVILWGPHVIAIYLGRRAMDPSVVLMDGVDISANVVAVDVYARAGELTTVTLTLLGPVEIHGEPGQIVINPRTDRD